MQRFSACWSKKLGNAIVEAALLNENAPYTMSLVGEDKRAVTEAVNQGIDSRLEACFCPARGDKFIDTGNRLECVVSSMSLAVLVRRLMESGNERAELLASDICDSLDIELI